MYAGALFELTNRNSTRFSVCFHARKCYNQRFFTIGWRVVCNACLPRGQASRPEAPLAGLPTIIGEQRAATLVVVEGSFSFCRQICSNVVVHDSCKGKKIQNNARTDKIQTEAMARSCVLGYITPQGSRHSDDIPVWPASLPAPKRRIPSQNRPLINSDGARFKW